MTLNKFNLPDVGEGLTEAEIVSWKVKAGDAVAINDVLCEIETAKSIVELPSPFAGTVSELLVPEGVTIDVGTAIISVSDEVAGDPTPADTRAPERPMQPLYGKLPESDGGTTDSAAATDSSLAGGPLVGSGPKADAVKRRPRRTAPAVGTPTVNAPEVEPVQPHTPAEVSAEAKGAQAGPATEPVDNRPTFGGAITGLVNKVLAKPRSARSPATWV
jgi:2-oxoisovalerate dehydrogenase E2 component (dihydrolipoyl transacylase)